jgi:HEAT repeat protein
MNVVSSLFPPIQAKINSSLIAAFGSFGVILSTFFVTKLQLLHEGFGLGTIPFVILIIIFGLNLVMVQLFKRDLVISQEKTDLSVLKTSINFIFRKSKLFKTVAIALFLIIGIQLFTDFKLRTVLPQNYSGTELTDMFGFVYLLEYAIAFVFNLFITKKLLFKFGVANCLIAYPIILVIFITLAIITGLNPIFVIIFFLSYAIPMYTYIPVAFAQIFSSLSKSIIQTVYFLIRGALVAITMLVLSLSLLIYTWNINLEKFLNTFLIALFAITLFIVLIKVKRNYLLNLESNLFKDDEYLKLRSIELLAEKASKKNKGEDYLLRLLKAGNITEEVKIDTISSLGIIGNYQSIVDLIEIIKKGSMNEKYASIIAINNIIKNKKYLNKYPVTKHLLLNVYEEILISDTSLYIKTEIISSLQYFDLEDIIKFLEKALKSKNLTLRLNSIETLGRFNDRGIVEYLEPLLNDENITIVSAAIAALWKFENLRFKLMPQFAKIISVNDEKHILSSLFIIRSINAYWEKKYLLDYVKSENDKIRIYAIVILIQFGHTKYIPQLFNEIQRFKKSKNLELIDFTLSQYKKLPMNIRKKVLRQIQHLDHKEIEVFYEIFSNSKYVFNFELNQLD